MKTTIKLLALAFVLFAAACSNDDEINMFNSLWRNVTQNEARINDLEEWCAQANTNITSLQTIVNVIESNDAITSITPVMEGGVEVGYTITFADHDPITIYHGKDGKDGKDGQDGTSPIVGVAKYTDGVYYWTLNGEWLLDENGNKLRVSGEDGKDGKDGEDGVDGADGKDGENGKDGADGQNGTNGQNGITPQLKIENDYWWISYDNGNTWTQLGKAKGEDGQTGEKGDKGDTGAAGADGQDGDSMFQSVTQDADNVYFTLADGTVITIAKGGGGADQPNSDFLTITYMPNGGEGEIMIDTVFYPDFCFYTVKYFAYTKEDFYFANWNTKANGEGVDLNIGKLIDNVTRNITLYAKWKKCTNPQEPEWVDLGLPSGLKWATCNVGGSMPEVDGNYYAWGEVEPKEVYSWSTYKWCNGSNTTLTKYCTDSSKGKVDNETILESMDDVVTVTYGGKWRMPTCDEFKELKTECIWKRTISKGVSVYTVTGPSGKSIILPVAGYRNYSTLYYAGSDGYYWSSSLSTGYSGNACSLYFYSDIVGWGNNNRSDGRSVRGVCP